MARKFLTFERKNTTADYLMDRRIHDIVKAHQYKHAYASEFEALFNLLTKQPFLKKVKSAKEREEREEKKIRLTRS